MRSMDIRIQKCYSKHFTMFTASTMIDTRKIAGKMGIIMNKNLFLDELHRLLSDLPPEERNQAIKYYEDYFEDAGPENEQAILKELGSPQELADQIKTTTQDDIEYGQGSSFHRSAAYPEFYAQKEQSDSQNENSSTFQQTKDGYQQGHQQAGNGFNSNGYRQTGNGFNNNSYQQAGNGFSNSYQQAGNTFNNNGYRQTDNGFTNSYQQAGNGFNNNGYRQTDNGFNNNNNNNNNNYQQTGNGFNNNNNYQQAATGYNSHYQQQSTRKAAWSILFVFLAITIGLPCLSVLFGILLTIFSVIVSIVLALFGTGGGLMIGGIASFFGSFFMTTTSGIGAILFAMGIGLVLFAIGALILWVGVLFCIRFLPALFQATWKSAKSVTLKFQQWIKKRW